VRNKSRKVIPALGATTEGFLGRRKKKAGPQHEVEARQFFVSTRYTPQAAGKQALANEANATEACFGCWRSRWGFFRSDFAFNWNRNFATGAAGLATGAARLNGTIIANWCTAAIADSAAATMMTTMATMVPMATMTSAVTSSASAIAAGRAVTRMATVATVPGLSLLLTAQEGDTYDRDEHRNPESQRTIHLQILQTNRYLSVRRNDPFAAAL
jgi:hypothetical protein